MEKIKQNCKINEINSVKLIQDYISLDKIKDVIINFGLLIGTVHENFKFSITELFDDTLFNDDFLIYELDNKSIFSDKTPHYPSKQKTEKQTTFIRMLKKIKQTKTKFDPTKFDLKINLIVIYSSPIASPPPSPPIASRPSHLHHRISPPLQRIILTCAKKNTSRIITCQSWVRECIINNRLRNIIGVKNG